MPGSPCLMQAQTPLPSSELRVVLAPKSSATLLVASSPGYISTVCSCSKFTCAFCKWPDLCVGGRGRTGQRGLLEAGGWASLTRGSNALGSTAGRQSIQREHSLPGFLRKPSTHRCSGRSLWSCPGKEQQQLRWQLERGPVSPQPPTSLSEAQPRQARRSGFPLAQNGSSSEHPGSKSSSGSTGGLPGSGSTPYGPLASSLLAPLLQPLPLSLLTLLQPSLFLAPSLPRPSSQLNAANS